MSHFSPLLPLPPDVPWTPHRAAFIASLREQIAFEALLIGAVHLQHPQPDEWLLAHRVDHAALLHWTRHQPLREDPLVQVALQHGSATGQVGVDTQLGPESRQVLVCVIRDPGQPRVHWLLWLAREKAFTAAETRLAMLWLSRWISRFLQCEPCDMGQALLGHDGRVLLADLETQRHLIGNPAMLGDLLGRLEPILSQRYPLLADDQTHDLVMPMPDQPLWVLFRRCRALERIDAVHWVLQLQAMDPDALPAVGLVSDDRIAHALAYIHAHYQEAPSLSAIAQRVRVSPFHFHRLFTREVGLSPKVYLQRKQLQVAKWRLRGSLDTIAQIAHATGFSSHGHFTTTFSRLVGQSPTDYREQAGKRVPLTASGTTQGAG